MEAECMACHELVDQKDLAALIVCVHCMETYEAVKVVIDTPKKQYSMGTIKTSNEKG
jgi:hypothetical protein